MNKIDILIPGSTKRPISLDISYSPDGHFKPVIILAHGFKGFKNWGHFDRLAEKIAESGFVCLKFNFSFNGTTPEHLIDFADLEAFGHNNYSIELQDTQKILDFTEKHIGLYQGDSSQIYMIGHSRGGGIAILSAQQDQRIKKLSSWASVIEFGKFIPENEIPGWKEKGVVHTFNSRTQQNMPLYYQLYENFLENKSALNIPAHARYVSIPWLIIHGTNDQTVPLMAAENLHELQPNSELVLLKNADHNFGGKHPWSNIELPADAEIALNKTLAFFSR